jgi:hypothetical protein
MSAAVAFLNGGLYRTAALYRGGSFSVPSPVPANYTYRIGRTDCPAGAICQELREYPVDGAGAKPIINNAVEAAQHYLFFVNETGDGGIRILNLKLQGGHTAGYGLNWGMQIYSSQHDWTIGNVTFDSFDLGVSSNGGTATNNRNIFISGSDFNNVAYFGVHGSANNMKVNSNSFIDTGGDDAFDHAIYTGAAIPVDGIEIMGNYIYGFYRDSVKHNTQCIGVMISGGGEESNVIIRGNTLVQDRTTVFGGCYGIAFGHHGYNVGGKLHNVEISDNVVVNGGNIGIGLQNCNVGCVIKNNIIYSEIPGAGIVPIMSAGRTSVGTCTPNSPVAGVTCADEQSSGIVIQNNTMYSTSNNTGGYTGIDVGIEGTGYVIANNTVTYMSSAAGSGVNCFSYGLATSAYSFINNNHCHSTATNRWEMTRGTLAAWKTYAAGSGFDTASFTGDPLFVSAGSDFSPTSGSPLIGAGNAAHGSLLDITGAVRPNPPSIGAFEPAGPGTLSIQASRKVSEGAPSARVRVNRIGGAIGAVGVSYATSNGTALAGSDYTTTSGTLSWPDGDGNPKFINVPILHDTITEPAKTFTVTLSNLTGSASLGNSTATVTLYDDDPATPFLDTANSSFLSYINALYGAGITTGCGGGNYCPTQAVNRAQMAAFVIRGVESDPVVGYCGSTPPFADVPVSNTFCGHIKRLKELAITTGCGSNNYCPNDNVPRDQMAAFIVRAVEGEPAATYCGSGSGFADVAQTNGFCRYIKRLAELNITTGCGGGNFCPAQTVTREQMAAFIARAFLGM